MDISAFLAEVCAAPGLPGMEGPVAVCIAEAFRGAGGEVSSDALGNVFAVLGDGGPTVLLCAHMDEIGLIATGFDERAGVTFGTMGGVDPRILPGMEVTIHGREPVYGVIGVKPPHLTDGAQKAPKIKELRIDTGLARDALAKLVGVGDPISFKAPVTRLMNGRIAGKSFDDRACVAALLCAMEELKNTNLSCRAVFCATVAEEVGSRGAMTAGYGVNPDMAVALDVTHGPCPGAERFETFPLDSVTMVKGPLLHPAMCERLASAAEACGVKVEIETAARLTYTDADMLQTAREGVPTALLSVPLSYMHTTVETISEKTVREAGRLLAQFIKGIGPDWGDWLCFKDC